MSTIIMKDTRHTDECIRDLARTFFAKSLRKAHEDCTLYELAEKLRTLKATLDESQQAALSCLLGLAALSGGLDELENLDGLLPVISVDGEELSITI